MAKDKGQPGPDESDAGATTGGGASTDRSGRDAGIPGPDSTSVPRVTTKEDRAPADPSRPGSMGEGTAQDEEKRSPARAPDPG